MAEELSRLDRSFYARPTTVVAPALLGHMLVCDGPEGRTSGRIVETEAYRGPEDSASHAARLKRGNVRAMSGPPGIAYMYRSYGMHVMLNVVCEPAGENGSVLIRALEPISGLGLMRQRRNVIDDPSLCRGPGRLCQALGLRLSDHGLDLVDGSRLWIERSLYEHSTFTSGRIGISRATEVPWRFFIADSPFVSSHRRGQPVSEKDTEHVLGS